MGFEIGMVGSFESVKKVIKRNVIFLKQHCNEWHIDFQGEIVRVFVI